MKKTILTSLTLFSTILLVACSSDKDTKNKTEIKSDKASKTVEKPKNKVDNSKFDSVVAKLNDELNQDNSTKMESKIENNVVESDYPNGHTVIRLLVKDDAKKMFAEIVEAEDANTATADQKNALNMLRMSISQIAKELPDDTTTIDFGYEVSADNYRLIAKSSKIKDIIPIGDLVME
ncbi:TPA: hypothetical protein ACJPXW_001042 [Streptococcus pyogenes]